ncbi:hypothetical protein F4861DRAFT_62876 [Xylaria intraflava]|nr:hypothetical protein F4861DRAFT_62876 [Xylaria intraflava]
MASTAAPVGPVGPGSPITPQEVADFLKLVNTLAASQSTLWINNVLKENAEVKAASEQKRGDNDSLLRAIADLTFSRDKEIENAKRAKAESDEAKAKTDKLLAEVESSKSTLADKDKALLEANKKIADLEKASEALHADVKARDDTIKKQQEQLSGDSARIKDLEGQLGNREDELKTTTGQLRELKDLSCEMIDMPQDVALAKVNKVYDRAKAIAFRYFGADLSAETLRRIEAIQNSGRSRAAIPLFPSNAPHAKRARVALFMYALGCRLSDQIFVPFYLSSDDSASTKAGINPISLLLSKLPAVDQRRTLQLRSLLPAIAPEEQRIVATSKADHISRTISKNLGGLLDIDQKDQFKTEVHELCRLAVTVWDTLRRSQTYIEPFAWTSEVTKDMWAQAELDASSPSHQQINGNQSVKSSRSTISLKASADSLRSASEGDLIPVWPGFTYGSEGILKKGFRLLEWQVKDKGSDEDQPSLRRISKTIEKSAAPPFQSQPDFISAS